MQHDEIDALIEIIEESANIADSSNDLSSVVSRIKTGQRLSTLLEQYERQGLHLGEPKASDCKCLFFDLKEVFIHKALKRFLERTLTNAAATNSIHSKVGYYNSFISEINNHRDDYSEDNCIYANSLERQVREIIATLGENKTISSDFEIRSVSECYYLAIPSYGFTGSATPSPDGRYFTASYNNMVALVDTKYNHLMYVYDIFQRADQTTLVVTEHPLVLVRDIVSIRPRQNDIYLLNHRSDILLKETVDAHVHKLAVSEDGKFVAAQTLDNKIRLFSVEEAREAAVWTTPKRVAIELMIDTTEREVRMLDYQKNIYSYAF